MSLVTEENISTCNDSKRRCTPGNSSVYNNLSSELLSPARGHVFVEGLQHFWYSSFHAGSVARCVYKRTTYHQNSVTNVHQKSWQSAVSSKNSQYSNSVYPQYY